VTPGRERLDALTGLRFLAAIGVVAFHYWHDQLNFMGRLPFVVAGFSGVSLFFVLSGFVLGYNYLDRAKTIRPLAFYWARFARIYPVYILGAVVAGAYIWRHEGGLVAVPQFFFSLPLVQAWMGKRALDGNGVGWSLSVEALFYAIFPVIALRFAKLDSRGAMRAVLWSSAVALVPQLVACVVAVPHTGLNTNDDLGSLFKFFPLFHVPEFTAGVALARYQSLRRKEEPVWRSDVLFLAGIGAVWLLAATPWKLPWPLMFTGGLVLPFCLVIHALSSRLGFFVRVLGSKPMILLGESSYALYILHVPIFWYFSRYLPNPRYVALLAVVLSVVVFLFFERPMRNWLMRLQSKVTGPAAQPAAVAEPQPI